MRLIFPFLLLSFITLTSAIAQDRSYFELKIGVKNNGIPSKLWLQAIKPRLSEEKFSKIHQNQKNFTKNETGWLRLIKSGLSEWEEHTDTLALPFRDMVKPDKVVILVGNQGGNDGFTFGSNTICFDLRDLVRAYGNSNSEQNKNRMKRIFAHEYTHLLSKKWNIAHVFEAKSNYQHALGLLLYESLGNYRSLSSSWKNKDGGVSPKAIKVLAQLQPIFVKRMTAIKTASNEEFLDLIQGMTAGPFSKKWGALTVALWLAMDSEGDDMKLRKWVDAGPQGILELANLYLPEALKQQLNGNDK